MLALKILCPILLCKRVTLQYKRRNVDKTAYSVGAKHTIVLDVRFILEIDGWKDRLIDVKCKHLKHLEHQMKKLARQSNLGST